MAKSYVPYVRHHYNTATIVFDPYNNPLSTKTNAHTRRNPIRCQVVVNGDADLTVVSAISVSSPKTYNPIMVVADNTDNAIMLLYHWNGEMSEIIFNSKKTETALIIASACSNLEDKEHLLFVHAWSVCDTASATFGKGKTRFLKLVNQSDELKDLSISISDAWTDRDYIGSLSVVVFRIMYSG